jgi:ppGpp synthetase/RelA/SpoT-type nucleotidyltranferase
MTTSDVSQRYFDELPHLKRALQACEQRVSIAAREIDPAVVVSGRVKSHRSVLGKIYRKGRPRTWESLGDLVALKAVLPTERGVNEFTKWVSSQSAWHPVLDNKTSAPNELAYQAKQFDLYWDELLDSAGVPIKVELQVRTAAADAWYVVDHRLRYKGTVALPSDLERKLYRLIVLTELFDQEVEAVIAQQASLPEYGVARLYEQLTRTVERLTDGRAKSSRPEALLELLLKAYAEDELPLIQEEMTAFIEVHEARLKGILDAHSYASNDFVEERDWMYYEPEALLVAERAMSRPAMLRAAIRNSDFESVLEPMISAFRSGLSN